MSDIEDTETFRELMVEIQDRADHASGLVSPDVTPALAGIKLMAKELECVAKIEEDGE